MPNKALCIGGSLDGTFRDADQAEVVVPLYKERKVSFSLDVPIQEAAKLLYEKYRLQILGFPDGGFGAERFYFYVLTESPPINIMERLITVYHADNWMKKESQ